MTYPDFVQSWLQEAEAALPDERSRMQARHALEEAYRAACKAGQAENAAWQTALAQTGAPAQYLARTRQAEERQSRKTARVLFLLAAVCAVYLAARVALTGFAPDTAGVYRNPVVAVMGGSGADMGFAAGFGLLCLAAGCYFRRRLGQHRHTDSEA